MSNHFRLVFILGLITLVLVGCGDGAEVEPAAAVDPVTTTHATSASAAETMEVTATSVPATETTVLATSTIVSPTDTPPPKEEPTAEATIVLAAKPQLLEFYTEW